MIKDFLLQSLPAQLAPPARPRDRAQDRRERRMFLILCVILLLSGWFVPAWIALLGAAILASVWIWAWSVGKEVVELIRGIGSALRTPGKEPKPALLERIRSPLIDQADPSRTAVLFEPRLPFQSPKDGLAWAIDPSRRAIRVMARAGDEVDRWIQWDEPIRSVEFQRVEAPRWLPMLGDTLAIMRRDRNLTILSGKDRKSEWRYVFHFSGLDRETGLRWREVFEKWMHEDRGRVAA